MKPLLGDSNTLPDIRQANGAPSTREAELLDLLDQAAELICTSDPSGRITYANRAWIETLGYTLEEAASLKPVELVAPEHRATYLDLARRVHGGAVVEGFEAVLIAKSGRRVVCRGRASARFVNGRLVEARALYSDVTEERRVDGMRARLAATLEATTDFVSVATRTGKIVFLNRAGRRLIGLADNADLSTMRSDDLYDPLERPRLASDAVPAALREGKWDGETRLHSVTGEEIPVSMVIVAHPSTRKDDDVPYFLSTVMRDLRDRVHIEDALRESEGRFRGVLENLRLCAMVLDVDGRVLFANDHLLELTGWTRDELIGAPWGDNFAPSDAERPELRPHDVIGGASPTHYESDMPLRDGSSRRMEWDSVPLRDATGGIVAVARVGRDIDAERRVQMLKDQLIATVSHELRSPLTAVLGALKLLSAAGAEGRSRTMLDMAIRNTDRVLRLITSLLDIERVEAGTLHMELAPVAVQGLIDDVIQVMAHAAQVAGVVLQRQDHTGAGALLAMADTDRIMQVLMNLVNNAIKFSPSGGTIVLGAAEQDGMILISVADEGRGIPPDKLESIFERFEQVHAADAREKGGAGLGLAIARAIVVKHGGRIWAESVAGKGSVFYLTLTRG